MVIKKRNPTRWPHPVGVALRQCPRSGEGGGAMGDRRGGATPPLARERGRERERERGRVRRQKRIGGACG
jgi:hypothetical protein